MWGILRCMKVVSEDCCALGRNSGMYCVMVASSSCCCGVCSDASSCTTIASNCVRDSVRVPMFLYGMVLFPCGCVNGVATSPYASAALYAASIGFPGRNAAIMAAVVHYECAVAVAWLYPLFIRTVCIFQQILHLLDTLY